MSSITLENPLRNPSPRPAERVAAVAPTAPIAVSVSALSTAPMTAVNRAEKPAAAGPSFQEVEQRVAWDRATMRRVPLVVPGLALTLLLSSLAVLANL